MSPEKLKSPEAVDLIDRAVSSMKSAVADFHDFPKVESLMTAATQVWTDLNNNKELGAAVEMDIKQKRMMLHQMGMLDMTNGDPVRRRYDPYEWQSHIPKEYKNREGEFIKERCETLITFLEALKGQE